MHHVTNAKAIGPAESSRNTLQMAELFGIVELAKANWCTTNFDY